MGKRILALLTTAFLLTDMIPATVFADEIYDTVSSTNSVTDSDAFSDNNRPFSEKDSLSSGNQKNDNLSDDDEKSGMDKESVGHNEAIEDNEAIRDNASIEAEELEKDEALNDGKKDSDITKKEKRVIELPAPGTITGFEVLDQKDSLVTIYDHIPEEELADLMPESIFVHLNNSPEAVELPVIWESEVDYATTAENYYIFWANWDEENYPLVSGYNREAYIPFVEVVYKSPIMLMAYSDGVQNIVDRALMQVNVRWTPLQNVNGFSSNTDQLTVFKAGKTYSGIPYGQQVYNGTWVPNTTSIDTFVNAVNTIGSPFYLSRGRYGDMDSTYYANDCSAFASYCYGLPRMTTSAFGYSSQFSRVAGNSIFNAEVGDCFNAAGSHIEMITGMNYENGSLVSVEVCEQTPPTARTVIYTPDQCQYLINKGYTLLRFNGRDTVPACPGYSGYDRDIQEPVKVVYSTEEASELSVTDRNGDGTVFDIRMTGLEYYSKTDYKAAVWSDENGQDDLQWIKLNRQTNADYTASLKISSFKHRGNFIIHIYKMDGNQNLCLKRSSFDSDMNLIPEVPVPDVPVTAESVTIEKFNNDSGTCRLLVNGVSSEGGVSKVEIPVWSDSKQADIYWYQAKKLNDTTWYADFNLSRHKYNTGTFMVHAYATNLSGTRNFVGKTEVTFSAPETAISYEVQGSSIACSATGVAFPGGIKSVTLAVWSDENGQDDLKWNSCKYDASSATANIQINADDYKHYGRFIAHLYANTMDGKLVCLVRSEFFVEEPPTNQISCDYNNATGDFKVTIVHPKVSAGTVDSIVVPTWSAANQSDIVWYDATKKANGSYVISGNIKNHKGVGTYNCHVYARVKGKLVFIDKTGFTAEIRLGSLTASEATSGGKKVPVQVSGLESPIAFSKVVSAVWSEKNGQDDLKWYTMSDKGSGNFAVNIDMLNHKTEGLYHVHLYGVTPAGKNVFIERTTFTFNNPASAEITVTDETPDDGRIQVKIDIDPGNWTYSSVTVPTWNAADQSDIHWYKATKNVDGTWTINVDKKNHKGHTGTYQIHVYADFDNGIFGFIDKTVGTLGPEA